MLVVISGAGRGGKTFNGGRRLSFPDKFANRSVENGGLYSSLVLFTLGLGKWSNE